MTKLLQFNAKAQYSIKKGVDTLTNAVKVTIGPKGRNVVLDHPLETPKVLNDGVTIARGGNGCFDVAAFNGLGLVLDARVSPAVPPRARDDHADQNCQPDKFLQDRPHLYFPMLAK